MVKQNIQPKAHFTRYPISSTSRSPAPAGLLANSNCVEQTVYDTTSRPDQYQVAALYWAAIARGHIFNAANKRTAVAKSPWYSCGVTGSLFVLALWTPLSQSQLLRRPEKRVFNTWRIICAPWRLVRNKKTAVWRVLSTKQYQNW
ncbi:hypothetical protein [Mixta sp. Marseille-Q2659]|uniref:hypothetical protein n=1 Tax=Mixta sp. Marseille-Q2659 TaxID=2736607 RepID=UPI0023B936A1|nr:hypothetical protein [Mixta sp. Marseille-Q2659]